jgi:hypothetical protein
VAQATGAALIAAPRQFPGLEHTLACAGWQPGVFRLKDDFRIQTLSRLRIDDLRGWVFPGRRAVVVFSPGKESDHENESIGSAGGVAVLAVGSGGDGRGALHAAVALLPGKLLRRRLLP